MVSGYGVAILMENMVVHVSTFMYNLQLDGNT